jgi:hypothetical protein
MNPGQPQNLDTASIYPDAVNTRASSGSDSLHNETQPAIQRRVSAAVPALRVYAILSIVYTLYSILTYATALRTIKTSTGGVIRLSPTFSPWMVMAIGSYIVAFAVAGYLLFSKSFSRVEALLTVMLVLSGIGLSQSVITVIQYPSSITLRYGVSLLISGALFMYLWSVRKQVESAS